ncbi:MAG: endonuclease MutS2 [Chloroflexota bacterium]
MNERALRVLEYDRIRGMLADLATSERGKELAGELAPLLDYERIAALLAETSEARGVLRSPSPVPLGGIHDLRQLLLRCAAGSTLEPRELLDVADTIAGGRNLRIYLLERKLDFPRLAALAADIGTFADIETAINRAIDDHGEVRDDASPELAHVRRQQRIIAGRIKDKMESYIRSAETQKLLQDPIVTIREDRYVIPVKQEYRSQLPGIVHDQSSSGATLFIEPLAVVEMNNELRQLELRERDEIRRILRELTERIGRQAEQLRLMSETLATLDFAFARGKLSRDQNAVEPELNQSFALEIRKGRHPLLTGAVVPIDVTLGMDFDTLVITGPNTGGKTVTLKTIGLLTLMMMSGLHVPADHGTRLAVFEDIFCDIGDEQSISQSLSTFSSHMTNIVAVTKTASERSLVLLDELGAGTDPAEGAALAMSILEHLHAVGAKTVATTHYSELKTFAYTRERIENASVEFDVETLRPTYRLLIGMPGSSNAFEISHRLGLADEIIDRARSFLSRDDLRVDELIRQIEAKRISLEGELRQAEDDRRKIRSAKEQYDARMRDLAARERQTLERAQQQAIDVLTRARREAEDVIKEIRASASAGEVREREQAIQRARARLRTSRSEIIAEFGQATEVWGPVPEDLRPGESVEIKSLRQVGHVLSAPTADGQVLVQAGIMKIKVPIADLQRVSDPMVKAPVKRTAGEAGATSGGATVETISPEVDLRGLTADDALFRLDKYLDDAYLAGLASVRIIHGKGTGALRQAVRSQLKAHPHVSGQRPGALSEGGDGVTVVELKVK